MLTVQNYLDAAAHFSQDKSDIRTAAEFYRQALVLDPDNMVALIDLGAALAEIKDPQADAFTRLAVEREPHNAFALAARAKVDLNSGELAEAAAKFYAATELEPSHANFRRNLAHCYTLLGRWQDAESEYMRACELAPQDLDTRTCLAMAQMAHGDWDAGLANYDVRLAYTNVLQPGIPVWTGKESLDGKVIVIHMEQGDGDAIMCARYASALRSLWTCDVVVTCSERVRPLMLSCYGIDEAYSRQDVTGHFQVAAMSLPRLMRQHDLMYGLREPYLQIHRPPREDGGPLRVGFCWRGNPNHANDFYRSESYDDIAPLLTISGVDPVSLQRGFAFNGVHPADDTWVQTAYQIADLDLVISVDTAVCHLAGAMGVPTWTMLAFCPDWRWGLSGATTPWYQSMTLFRQQTLGDWKPVVETMAGFLNDKAKEARDVRE